MIAHRKNQKCCTVITVQSMWNQKSQAGIKFGKMLQFIAETAVSLAMEEVTKDKNAEILKRLGKKIHIRSFAKKINK